MSKKVASTKLLSGLFVAGGVLGMNQVAKADSMVSSEATKPVITTEADNLVVVPTEAVAPVATTEVGHLPLLRQILQQQRQLLQSFHKLCQKRVLVQKRL